MIKFLVRHHNSYNLNIKDSLISENRRDLVQKKPKIKKRNHIIKNLAREVYLLHASFLAFYIVLGLRLRP